MKRHYGIIALIMLCWFVISFITNIIGPLIPDIIRDFRLEQMVLAGFIPSSFFIAYAVMSVPAGLLMEKMPAKYTLITGFSLPLIGSALFAALPGYGMLLVSCFIIGLGMSMLQTIINPLTRTAGGEEHFAFYSVMGQLVFGAASFLSPFVYARLAADIPGHPATGFTGLLASLTPDNAPWISLYWVFIFVLAGIMLIISMIRFPHITFTADEQIGEKSVLLGLLKNPQVRLFFWGIFAYVAFEQGVANWISRFLEVYHGGNPQVEGANTVAWFWGSMSIGCLLGLLALKVLDAQVLLRIAVAGASLSLLAALTMSMQVALLCFPLVAFFISVMFSIVMSLGLNSFSSHHGSLAGIFCSGIAGGAVGPFVVGLLADWWGLQPAMFMLFIPLLYIFMLSFRARPLVRNKTISLRKANETDTVSQPG